MIPEFNDQELETDIIVEYYCCFNDDNQPCEPFKDFRIADNRSWSPCCKKELEISKNHARGYGFMQTRAFDENNHELKRFNVSLWERKNEYNKKYMVNCDYLGIMTPQRHKQSSCPCKD